MGRDVEIGWSDNWSQAGQPHRSVSSSLSPLPPYNEQHKIARTKLHAIPDRNNLSGANGRPRLVAL